MTIKHSISFVCWCWIILCVAFSVVFGLADKLTASFVFFILPIALLPVALYMMGD